MPVLIGILAVMLSVHPATAIEHSDASLMEVQEGLSEDHELGHTLHVRGCCTVACGLVAPVAMVVDVPFVGSMFAQAADETRPVGLLKFKHFRPPRFT